MRIRLLYHKTPLALEIRLSSMNHGRNLMPTPIDKTSIASWVIAWIHPPLRARVYWATALWPFS